MIGRTIGSVSAWNAAGSILGTVGAGFWLVAALGPRSLTMAVAVLLAASGAAMGPVRILQVAWTLVVVVGLVLTRVDVKAVTNWTYGEILRAPTSDLFRAESAYQQIRVYESASDDGQRTLRVLALDHLVHGYIAPDDPNVLNYEYERILPGRGSSLRAPEAARVGILPRRRKLHVPAMAAS